MVYFMKVLEGLVISRLILNTDVIHYCFFNLFVCLI